MNVFVEHDAAMIARLAGAPRLLCDGLIVRYGHPDQVLAATVRQNPLDKSWACDLDLSSTRVLVWSGTLATGDESEGLFAKQPLNWMRAGREALDAFCRELGPQLVRHGRRLCLRPHCRHVLSDVPSCLSFLAGREREPFEIALAPADMLAPSMLQNIEDHLVRMFEALAPRCAMVILHDVCSNWTSFAADPPPLGQGAMPRRLVMQLLRDHVPRETPVVISARHLQEQLEWLGACETQLGAISLPSHG